MTLIQYFAGFDEFAMVATDTRVVEALFTSDDVIRFNSFEIDNKAVLITDKVIFSMAGSVFTCKNIFNELKESLKPFYDLDDCKKTFESVCTKHLEKFMSAVLNKEDRFTVSLTGFKKDGTTGILAFSSSSGLHESPHLRPDYPLFMSFDTPSKDLNEKERVFYDLNTIVPAGSRLVTFVNHFAKVHGIVSRVEPESVSPQCIYHFLIKDEDGNIKYEQSRADLSSLVESMPTKEELLEQIRQQAEAMD